MENILKNKINIGISACQFGCKVRYNKKGWDMLSFIGRQSGDYIWHPLCPETMSGMGVPRNPIRLTGGNGDDFWEGNADIKDRYGKNMNNMVKLGAYSCLETLKRGKVSVFIFMEGSPSCGVYRTTLKNNRLGKPPGIFGSLLLKEEMFLIPASDLSSPVKWWDWRRRMFAFLWLKEKEFIESKEIVESWHILKFLCQDISRVKADNIGKKIADLKSMTETERKDMRKEILNLLRTPVKLEIIKQGLWKNYTFLRKKYNIDNEKIMSPIDKRNVTHIAEELLLVEIMTTEKDILFGSVPIHYEKHSKEKNVEEKEED